MNTTKKVTHNGETLTVKEWTSRFNLTYHGMHCRILNYGIEKAVSMGHNKRENRFDIATPARELGIEPKTLQNAFYRYRVKHGKPNNQETLDLVVKKIGDGEILSYRICEMMQ